MNFDPIDEANWPHALKDMQGGFATQLNVYRTMAHHPALLRAWSGLRDHVVRANCLPDDDLEIVILRTGVRRGSAYEWAHHVVRGRKAGLTDTEIAAAQQAPSLAASERHAMLMSAVDELVDENAFSNRTVEALGRAYGPGGVFDVIATVGMYTTLSFILNSFETPIDHDVEAALKTAPPP